MDDPPRFTIDKPENVERTIAHVMRRQFGGIFLIDIYVNFNLHEGGWACRRRRVNKNCRMPINQMSPKKI
jgi:hypothetical protein